MKGDDNEKTLVEGATHLYEDDGLLILFAEHTRADEISRIVAAGYEAGWQFYSRLDHHNGAYLIFLF